MSVHTYLQPLVSDLENIIDEGGTPEFVTERIAEALRKAMQGNELEEMFRGKEKSFQAYEDPERMFIIHASVHKPGHVTRAHDHGESWAVYGCYRGTTRYRRYKRVEELQHGVTKLQTVRDEVVPQGGVDIVPPGEVHDISTPETDIAWNIVIRPRSLTQVWRRRYDVETGEYKPFRERES